MSDVHGLGTILSALYTLSYLIVYEIGIIIISHSTVEKDRLRETKQFNQCQ